MDFCRLRSYNIESQNNTDNTFPVVDTAEAIGSLLSSSLILACGDEVKVTSSDSGLTFQTQEKRDTILRIFFAVIALAILPLTLIGLICKAASTSYSERNALYSQHTVKPITAEPSDSSGPASTTQKDSPAKGDSVKKVTAQTATSVASAAAIKQSGAANLTEPGTPPRSPAHASAAVVNSVPPRIEKVDPIITKLPDFPEWESKIKESQPEELHAKMSDFYNQLQKYWKLEKVDFATLSKEAVLYNETLFAMLKKNNGNLATPRDFLWCSQGYSAQPTPITNETTDLQLEENVFYEIIGQHDDPNSKTVQVKKLSDLSELNNAREKQPTGIKYSHGQVGIFSPQNVLGFCIHVNGRKIEPEKGGGSKTPIYNLSEGDVVSHNSRYLFTVGPNGKLRLPGEGHIDIQRDQGVLRATTMLTHFPDSCRSFKYAKPISQHCVRPVEVGIQEKLAPGFQFPSKFDKYNINAYSGFVNAYFMEKSNGFVIIADIKNDPVFQQIVNYLKKEFELFPTDNKFLRLALFAQYISREGCYDLRSHNFYLGERINAGYWKKEHSAFLIKALADQLDLNCALVTDWLNDRPNNDSWNICYENDKFYILDLKNFAMSPIDEFPSNKNWWKDQYGLTGIDLEGLKKEINPPPAPVAQPVAAAVNSSADKGDAAKIAAPQEDEKRKKEEADFKASVDALLASARDFGDVDSPNGNDSDPDRLGAAAAASSASAFVQQPSGSGGNGGSPTYDDPNVYDSDLEQQLSASPVPFDSDAPAVSAAAAANSASGEQPALTSYTDANMLGYFNALNAVRRHAEAPQPPGGAASGLAQQPPKADDAQSSANSSHGK
jgi:hypothetical protein